MNARKTTKKGPLRAAVYCRISKDDTGRGEGVERQEETCRQLAGMRGWVVDDAHVYVENDTSASKKKPRPRFEAMVKAMESGQIDAVIAYRLDRLTRRLHDTARLIEIAVEHDVVITTVSGDMDLGTAQGRVVAGILTAVAQGEADALAERLRARNDAARRKGKMPNGGGPFRLFGFAEDRVSHEPPEADAIRECTRMLIEDGASMTSVVRWLNAEGFQTTGGGAAWRIKSVRDVLSNARIAGLVSYQGEIVTDDDGEPVLGVWDPIISPADFHALQVAMESRRVVQESWTTARRHLLSGSMARCGICDQKLIAFLGSNQQWVYRCRGDLHKKGEPGGLSRNRDKTDRVVLDKVIEFAKENPIRISDWDDDGSLDGLTREIAAEEKKLRALEDGFLQNGGDPARLARMTAEIDKRLIGLRADLADRATVKEHREALEWAQFDLSKVLASSASLLPHGTESQEKHKAKVMDEQHAVLALYVEKVVIQPTEKRGRGFDAESVEVFFRDPNRVQWRGTVEEIGA